MHWLGWIVVALAVLEGGWMAFDGGRAFVVGDYVTPRSGPYAGQLGPWSKVVAAVGIEPRSTAMKAIHLLVGLAGLVAAAGFVARTAWGWKALLIFAICGLWYLPFGTLLGVVQIVLLLLPALRPPAG
ncbi:MAG: hypothetical protein R3F20_08540 [Planctomycetota bacterium]